MVTTVYIVRHAHARGNEERFFQGCLDTDLSKKGEEQLLELSKRFSKISLDKIFSSDLLRAKKTAQAVKTGAGFKGEILFLKELREMSFGSLEGVSIDSFYKDSQFEEKSKLWDNQPESFSCENGETMEEVFLRMKSAFLDILNQNKGKSLAIVSHGCSIRNLCAFLLGGDISFLKSTPWVHHADFATFKIDENGNVFLSFC